MKLINESFQRLSIDPFCWWNDSKNKLCENDQIVEQRSNQSSWWTLCRVSKRINYSGNNDSKSKSWSNNGEVDTPNKQESKAWGNPFKIVVVDSLSTVEHEPLLITQISRVVTIACVWITSFLDLLTKDTLMFCTEVLFHVLLSESWTTSSSWEDESNQKNWETHKSSC